MLQLSRLRRAALSTGPKRNGAAAVLPALQNCRADSERECAEFAEQEQTQISGFEVVLAYLVLIVLFLGMAWIAIDVFRRVAYLH